MNFLLLLLAMVSMAMAKPRSGYKHRAAIGGVAGPWMPAADSTDTDNSDKSDKESEPEPDLGGGCCDPRECEFTLDTIGNAGRCLRLKFGPKAWPDKHKANILAHNDCQVGCVQCITSALGIETSVDEIIKTCTQTADQKRVAKCVLDNECIEEGVNPACIKTKKVPHDHVDMPNNCVAKCIVEEMSDSFIYVTDKRCADQFEFVTPDDVKAN